MTNEQSVPQRTVLWLLVALVAVAVLMGLLMSAYGGLGWMAGGGWMMAFGGLMMTLPLLIAILVVYAVVPRHVAPAIVGDARSILEARYARGEIDRQGYLQAREDLERERPR